MDIKVNQVIQPTVNTENVQNNGPADEAFRFTLMSAIEEEGLQERLTLMYEDITMQGNKITKHMDVKDMNIAVSLGADNQRGDCQNQSQEQSDKTYGIKKFRFFG